MTYNLPTATIATTDLQYWTGRINIPGNKIDGWIAAEQGTFVGWVKFDLTTLPTGISVTSLMLYGYVQAAFNAAPRTVNLRGLLSDPVVADPATILTECTSGTLYVSGYNAFPAAGVWVSTDLGATAYSDIVASKSQGWFAVCMEGTSGGDWGYWRGHDWAERPYIEVTYILLAPEIDSSTLLLLPILLIFAVAVRSNNGRKR